MSNGNAIKMAAKSNAMCGRPVSRFGVGPLVRWKGWKLKVPHGVECFFASAAKSCAGPDKSKRFPAVVFKKEKFGQGRPSRVPVRVEYFAHRSAAKDAALMWAYRAAGLDIVVQDEGAPRLSQDQRLRFGDLLRQSCRRASLFAPFPKLSDELALEKDLADEKSHVGLQVDASLVDSCVSSSLVGGDDEKSPGITVAEDVVGAILPEEQASVFGRFSNFVSQWFRKLVSTLGWVVGVWQRRAAGANG